MVQPCKFDGLRLVLNDFKIMDQCLPKQREVFGRQDSPSAWWFTHIMCSLSCLAELVHRVVFTASLQRSFTGKIFLVIVTNVGA